MVTLVLYCFAVLIGQGVAGQSLRPIGAVLAIDSSARRITIKTGSGPQMTISFEDGTRFLRVAPDAKDLQNAVSIKFSDLMVGDRILARGRAGDAGTFAATSIIIMSKEDLAKKHAAERADWEKRGTGGVITALDPGSKEITVTAAGSKPMVIAFAPGAVLRRYASNSVKFNDALPSRFEELKMGDQVKARGTGIENRSRFVAEELVSGSFRTIAATVLSIDAGQSIVQITELTTNKRMQAAVTADSAVHRLSAEVVRILAARIQGAGAPSSSGEVQAAISKLPPLAIADLKPGEAIILTCTNGDDPSRATAITLLAGAEPLFKSKGGKPLDLGSWNLDLNMSVGVP